MIYISQVKLYAHRDVARGLGDLYWDDATGQYQLTLIGPVPLDAPGSPTPYAATIVYRPSDIFLTKLSLEGVSAVAHLNAYLDQKFCKLKFLIQAVTQIDERMLSC